MLTLNNIRQFKDDLEILLRETSELLEVKTRKSLFLTKEDIDYQSQIKHITPSEYYFCRVFEKYIELSRRGNIYYLYTEHYYPKNPDLKALLYQDRKSTAIYNFNNNQDFNTALKIYHMALLDIVHQYSTQTQEELFYIY